MDVIIALIGQLPNLSVFELDAAMYRCDWILHLATRPSLRLSIDIMSSHRVDEGKPMAELAYTATSLVMRGTFGPLIGHLLF